MRTKAWLLLLLLVLLLPKNAFGQDSEEMGQVIIKLDQLRKLGWCELYRLNEFDCSNMSALLSKIFSNYKTYIAIGPTDEKLSKYHAMLIIEADGTLWWIEPTNLNLYIYNPFLIFYGTYNNAEEAILQYNRSQHYYTNGYNVPFDPQNTECNMGDKEFGIPDNVIKIFEHLLVNIPI